MSATSLLFLALSLLPQDQAQPARRGDFDVLIVGGSVHDGTGAKATRADVAIKGDRIAAIGDLAERTATLRIDASGMVVCPGFIDLHNHGDKIILTKTRRQNLCYITQGCTTIVTGNCGGGKRDVGSYFRQLAKQGCGVNVAHLIPQGSVRQSAMGGSFNRPPTDIELLKMKELVNAGMEAGAFGMSTGLIYTPSGYAKTGELIQLAKVVAGHAGIYASHIRDEGDELLAAVKEAIQIGESAGCPVHISHFKASKPPNWGKVRKSCALVEEARARGRRVTCDQYPYRASSTSLAALTIPTWAREGSNKDLVERFDDDDTGPKIRAAILESLKQRGGADQILIASYSKNKDWNGLNLKEAAARAKQDPTDLIVDIQRNGGCSAVAFSMCDEDVEYVMAKPYVATASDGSSKVKGPTRPHPRSYGTFPRKIGHYAIGRKVIGLGLAIRSSSGLPADILGLEDRGYLRKGAFADVVVFDPKRFRDKATFVDPHQHSEGCVWVFVNGVAAIKDGKTTGSMSGRVVRHPKKAK